MYRKYVIFLYFLALNSEASNINTQSFFSQGSMNKSISRSKQKNSGTEFKLNDICNSALENIKQYKLSSNLASDISIATFGLTCSLWIINLIFPDNPKSNKRASVTNIYTKKDTKSEGKNNTFIEANTVKEPDIILKFYFSSSDR
jgi:hypothetical protein